MKRKVNVVISLVLAAIMCLTLSADGISSAMAAASEKADEGYTIKGILGSEIVCLGVDKSYADDVKAGQGEAYMELSYNSLPQDTYNVLQEFNEQSALFGQVIDTQMNNYLYNNSGKKAVPENDNKGNGILSMVTFDLSQYSFYQSDELMLFNKMHFL